MPHIVIEYSENLTAEVRESGLMQRAHKVVLDSGLFSPEAVKARAQAYSNYVLPENVESFIHITVSILAGRSVQQRLELSDAVHATAVAAAPNADKISVDIHEMTKETYRK